MFDLSEVISIELWKAIKVILPLVLVLVFIRLCISYFYSLLEAFSQTAVGKVIVLGAIVLFVIKFG